MTILDDLRPDWQHEAACRAAGVVVDWFFADPRKDPATVGLAKQVCAKCPVRAQCLEYALSGVSSSLYDYGIWAGTTPSERDRIKVRRKLGVAS